MFEFKRGWIHGFTMTHLELVDSLASLKHLLTQVKEHQHVPWESVGICSNWLSDFSHSLVTHFGSQWPKSAHHGMYHAYPISSNGVHLWEGVNRELRIDLMEFIVSKLEQLIKGNSV